jgi:hypothetical protein
MIKTRLALPALAALAAVAIAGCGGGSSSDVAGLAPPDSLFFVEGTLRPTGSLKENVDSIASKVAGVDDLGDLIVEELEKSAREDGEPLDFEAEVEPWLGEEAGVAFKGLEGSDSSEPLVIVETTDGAAAKRFVEKQTRERKVPYEDGSYEGVDFKVGGKEGDAIGAIGEYLVVANDEAAFKAAVDASNGESLADESRFSEAMSNAADGSLADIYADVGGLIDKSGGQVDPQVRELLQKMGIDLSEATAFASVVPSSDQIELVVSSEHVGEGMTGGDASALIGELPADSFAALGYSDFNELLEDELDQLDANGIPGELEPHQLKQTLNAIGIDLDKIAASLGEAAAFAEGTDRASLGGALVLTSDSGEAAKAVANLGVLLRNTGTPGVTAVGGEASGFSIRKPELGSKPLVVAAKGTRVAIGYGLAPTLRGLGVAGGETLSDDPTYREAVAALGDTPISGFVTGGAALRLAEALVPHTKTGFWKATRYLKHIAYIAIGSASGGEPNTSRNVIGIK